MADKKLTQNVVHGVIIGGSIGLIGSWMGMNPGIATFLGLCCGFLAGLTKYHLDKRLKK